MSDHPLFNAAQVRVLDRLAIAQLNITGYALMRRAAQSAYALFKARWPDARSLAVVCGGGNNGGDGLVMAVLAQADGLDVTVFMVGQPECLQNEAKQAWADCTAAGITPQHDLPEVFNADVVVDALLGTGLDRPVEGAYLQWIEFINRSENPVFSLDIPSGLNADTGSVMGMAVRADLTLSFVGRKLGLYTGSGSAYAGDREFDDLQIPHDLHKDLQEQTGISGRLLEDSCCSWPGPRLKDAHKGDHGHVLCIGGDEGMSGAIQLCAEAALRVGAGLVSVATREAHAALLNIRQPELMVRPVERLDDLQPLFDRASTIVIGPGLGQSDWGRVIWNHVRSLDLPMVIDADALNLLAETPQRKDSWILTPHPGEAARLLQISSRDVQQDRPSAVRALQQQYGGVVVLKGAGSLILSPESAAPWVCAAGNPGMASGGMGDVLAGCIAGLTAQQVSLDLSLTQITALAVYLHACAADRLAMSEGERGLLASDLLPVIRQQLNPGPLRS